MLLSYLFYSCTGTESKEINDENAKAVTISISELIQKVNEVSSQITSVDAEGDISIDTPEMSNNGSITVSIFKPDSIFTKLEGPFGISVADILITRNNFIYYNIMDNVAIKGSSTPLNLGAITQIKLSFDEILQGYSGSFKLTDVDSSNSQLFEQSNNYIFKITDTISGNKIKYTINKNYFTVTKYEVYNKVNKPFILIEYSEFDNNNNIHFPNKIYFSKPDERKNVWISYTKKTFNKNKLTYRIKIAKSAKLINWE